ncbi:MAG: hypothetical protein Q8909_15280 [Bacteroidota bacterium]|nr:hypothetical protein [Bacteroidota bacterium]
MEEFYKSIKAILYERISSPFYGTLILSWLIWNWKVPYVTFFVNTADIKIDKITYIIQNCNGSLCLIWGPILSTAILLTIFPLITNGAYWVTLKYDQWRINQRNTIEKKQRLTVEQSNQLRLQIRSMADDLERIIAKKEEEVKALTYERDEALQNRRDDEEINRLKDYSKKSDEVRDSYMNKLVIAEERLIKVETELKRYKDENRKKIDLENEFLEFQNDEKYFSYFDSITDCIQREVSLSQYLSNEIINYYIANDIITKINNKYDLTDKGKYFLKKYVKIKG